MHSAPRQALQLLLPRILRTTQQQAMRRPPSAWLTCRRLLPPFALPTAAVVGATTAPLRVAVPCQARSTEALLPPSPKLDLLPGLKRGPTRLRQRARQGQPATAQVGATAEGVRLR
jgi:hypothetical protein